MRWAGHVARMGGEVRTGFCENTLKDRTFGRPRHRWENNIKLDLREIGLRGGCLDWTELT